MHCVDPPPPVCRVLFQSPPILLMPTPAPLVIPYLLRKYSIHANNNDTLYLHYDVNLSLNSTIFAQKTANNRGEGPQMASHSTNSSA